METETPNTSNLPQIPILEIAWKRHTELSKAASKRSDDFYKIRRAIIILGIVATLFAIVTQLYSRYVPGVLALLFKILFVATPVLASILAAFATKFYSNGAWLIYRAGSEDIKKEIYLYRTIWQSDKANRNANLRDRLAKIQRQLFRSLSGEFALTEYKGRLPSNYDPNDPKKKQNDPGFSDLTGEEYYKYRLKNQLDWHNDRVQQRKLERRWMTIYILAAGGLGAVLAAWSGPEGTLSIWVAFTASVTAGLIGWQELKNLDAIIKNYSKVVMELTILSDRWLNLTPKERENKVEFYKIVHECEAVLWEQHVDYIRSMQEALQEAGLDEESRLINEVIQRANESAKETQRKITDEIVDFTQKTLDASEEEVVKTMRETLGSLAEDAASEVVQKELAAMGEAVSEFVETTTEKVASVSEHLRHLAREYAGVDISRNTPKEELNAFLKQLPKSGNVKG